MSSSKSIPWWSSPRTLLRAILSLDDSAHSIAKGTAIGMFLGLTPTVGIQMVLVMLVSLFVRFNRKAALITVYISNPLTMIPIYWANYKVGTLFFEDTVTHEDFERLLTYHGFSEWLDAIHAVFIDVGMPLLFGSAIVATVGGVITYPLMRWLLRAVGKDKPHDVENATDPVDAVEPTANSAVKVVEHSVNVSPKTKPAETAG